MEKIKKLLHKNIGIDYLLLTIWQTYLVTFWYLLNKYSSFELGIYKDVKIIVLFYIISFLLQFSPGKVKKALSNKLQIFGSKANFWKFMFGIEILYTIFVILAER